MMSELLFIALPVSISRAMNETNRVISDESQAKENAEETVKVPLAEEMESSPKRLVDFSHKNHDDAAICITAAADNKSLPEMAEVKSE